MEVDWLDDDFFYDRLDDLDHVLNAKLKLESLFLSRKGEDGHNQRI